MSGQAIFDDFMTIMASGNPPLGLQLLVVNTVFLIVVILRRLRGRRSRNLSPHFMQCALLTANAMVAMEDLVRPYLHLRGL